MKKQIPLYLTVIFSVVSFLANPIHAQTQPTTSEAPATAPNDPDLNSKFRNLFSVEGDPGYPRANFNGLWYSYDYRRGMLERKQQADGFMKMHSLSEEELISIVGYTYADDEVIDKLLLNKTRGNLEIYVNILNRALSKLPDYEGWVWQMQYFRSRSSDQFQVGKTILEPQFTETTTWIGKAERNSKAAYEKDSKYFRIKILSRHGKNITPVAMFIEENETRVLFRSGTSFVVTERTEYKDPASDKTVVDVVMEEKQQ